MNSNNETEKEKSSTVHKIGHFKTMYVKIIWFPLKDCLIHTHQLKGVW